MILSADRIRELLENPPDLSERLFITPLLNANAQLKRGNASVDLRLGQRFSIPRRAKLPALDHLAPEHQQNIEKYKDESFIKYGDHFVLHPRQFVLGGTLEWVRLPRNLAAFVVGRSAWGRDGLVIATATGVHPGFSGILTLELANIGEIPVHLYPGVTIAQLFIFTVQTSGTGFDPSTFQMQTSPHAHGALSDDKEILLYFKKRAQEGVV
jgi:dCTP deaminase